MPEAVAMAVERPPAAAAERPRLLFVDDERRVLVSLKSIFRNDYDVRVTTSGDEALQILRDWDADVIVSDQRMPEITGVEVLKAAAEIRPQTTRVLLTGYSDLEAIIGSVNDSEVFRFVSKPWRRDDLSKTMSAAVRLARENPDAASPEHSEAAPVEGENSAASPQPVAEAVAAEPASNTTGVLVLDSNANEQQALRHTLDMSWPTFAAATIDEALQLLDAHPHIGVVITESVFEGGAVTSLVNGLRHARPQLVYIIVTHQPDAGHIIDLINYGQIYRVLRKPLRASVLRGVVTLAARRHQAMLNDPNHARRAQEGLELLPSERQDGNVFKRIRRFLGW